MLIGRLPTVCVGCVAGEIPLPVMRVSRGASDVVLRFAQPSAKTQPAKIAASNWPRRFIFRLLEIHRAAHTNPRRMIVRQGSDSTTFA